MQPALQTVYTASIVYLYLGFDLGFQWHVRLHRRLGFMQIYCKMTWKGRGRGRASGVGKDSMDSVYRNHEKLVLSSLWQNVSDQHVAHGAGTSRKTHCRWSRLQLLRQFVTKSMLSKLAKGKHSTLERISEHPVATASCVLILSITPLEKIAFRILLGVEVFVRFLCFAVCNCLSVF